MTEGRPIRYLLVEDDNNHARLVQRIMERSQVDNRVERVADGATALAYLRREGEFADRDRPDVVLLDLKLPKVGGHEVLRQIKEDQQLRTIPVVVLTTSQAEPDRARAYQHYVNSYLVKPMNFDRFRDMIEEVNRYWGTWNQPLTGQG